jgi:hypothetical protein
MWSVIARVSSIWFGRFVRFRGISPCTSFADLVHVLESSDFEATRKKEQARTSKIARADPAPPAMAARCLELLSSAS